MLQLAVRLLDIEIDDIRRVRIEVTAASTTELRTMRVGGRDRDTFAQRALCGRHRHRCILKLAGKLLAAVSVAKFPLRSMKTVMTGGSGRGSTDGIENGSCGTGC